MTNEMVEQLEDNNIMCYFVVINDDGPTSDVMMQIRKWVRFLLGKVQWQNICSSNVEGELLLP